MSDRAPQFVVAVVGGATAGAQAAGLLAARGITAVVFEPNPRPYGEIEDALPRWHVRLRKREYDTIHGRLQRPGVHFVPNTKIGRDLDVADLVTTWGFSAVVLAEAARRDRPLPIDGADQYRGKGLVYQSPLIDWFNHHTELGYDGPHYDVLDGAIVVGGGLASIDVMKVLQLEGVRRALSERGIDEDIATLETDGIPAVLAEHGLCWDDLGLHGATLYYRRRLEDMRLADSAEASDPAAVEKLEATRRRLLDKAMQKYGFTVCALRLPVGSIVERGRLAGLRFQRTRIEHGRVVPIDGAFEDVYAPLVVSAIGSLPAATPTIGTNGAEVEPGRNDTVFRLDTVDPSRTHGIGVSTHVIERFLGLGNGTHNGEEAMLAAMTNEIDTAANKIADAMVQSREPLPADQVETLLDRVRARQKAVGYTGTYTEWLESVTAS